MISFSLALINVCPKRTEIFLIPMSQILYLIFEKKKESILNNRLWKLILYLKESRINDHLSLFFDKNDCIEYPADE
jgi:hypothetical protein